MEGSGTKHLPRLLMPPQPPTFDVSSISTAFWGTVHSRYEATLKCPSFCITGKINNWFGIWLFHSHNQTFNIVLLRDGHEFVNDAADEPVAHRLGQGGVIVFRHHHVMQCGMSGPWRIDPDHQHRPRNGRRMRRAAMYG